VSGSDGLNAIVDLNVSNGGKAVVPERRFVSRQDVRSAPSHSSLPIMRELANGFGRDECG